MSAEDDEQQRFAKVDAALQHWRQGDCVVGERWFVFRIDAKNPLTQDAKQAGESELVESEVRGFAVVTQTCDIVRSCSTRPFIEVSPLVELPPTLSMTSAQRGQLSRYGWLPLLDESQLVVDLDRTMTVEKAVVAGWLRTSGLTTDRECRDFSRALARKRQRFAFPDDFVAWTSGLQARFKDKHGKKSPEGNALRALREIRVRAADSWDAETVEVTFWFIREGDAETFEGRGWDGFKTEWLKLLAEHPRFGKPNGQVTTLAMLTAQDFVDSDPLELDHLSRSAV